MQTVLLRDFDEPRTQIAAGLQHVVVAAIDRFTSGRVQGVAVVGVGRGRRDEHTAFAVVPMTAISPGVLRSIQGVIGAAQQIEHFFTVDRLGHAAAYGHAERLAIDEELRTFN